MSLDERLDKESSKKGCWLWTGGTNSAGYGITRVEGRVRYTHRLAYEQARGPIADGLVVLHACDTRRCCNPEHLSVGTHAENAQDRSAKTRSFGQRVRGSAKPGRRYW